MRKRHTGHFRPGNRRQRWQESHNISGSILFLIGSMWILAGITATNGAWICFAFGGLILLSALFDFRSAQRGWPLLDKRPAWADRHDAIDIKGGFCPDCAGTLTKHSAGCLHIRGEVT